MIRKCCICGSILGTKDPYWDMSITSGLCEPCFRAEMKKIEEYHINKRGEVRVK